MKQEEKLEEAKRLYETANADQRYVLESLFPELKESEDERIRKALIDYFSASHATDTFRGIPWDKVVAWLERQGKHTNFLSKIQVGDKVTRNEDGELVNLSQLARVAKPDDKVEPKFHEGDIIIHKELGGDYIHTPHKIIQVDILDKKYRLEGGLVAHFGEQEDYELVEQKPWSEEDGLQLQAAIDICKYSGCTITSDWLTSIKDRVQPQNRWKPSERQKEALLWCVVHLGGADKQALGELLKELNKL